MGFHRLGLRWWVVQCAASRHLIEQPMLASARPDPCRVAAISFIASNSSRRAPAGAGSRRDASSRPRYLQFEPRV